MATYLISASLRLPVSTPLLEVGVGIRVDSLIIKTQTWDLSQVGNHPPDVKEGVGKEGLGSCVYGEEESWLLKTSKHPRVTGEGNSTLNLYKPLSS